MFLKGEFSDRLVQVSLFTGIVYYITAYPVVFESARKYFPIKFKKTHHLLIFHTFVFAVLMYVLTYFVFDPIVRVVEGADGDDLQGFSSKDELIQYVSQNMFYKDDEGNERDLPYKDSGCEEVIPNFERYIVGTTLMRSNSLYHVRSKDGILAELKDGSFQSESTGCVKKINLCETGHWKNVTNEYGNPWDVYLCSREKEDM